MRHIPLYRIAKIIRSKNAKPYRLTLDILFNDKEIYNYVKETGVLSKKTVADAYGIDEELILSDFVFDMGMAFKFTLKRPLIQGEPGDSDIYGAQQHVPLMFIKVPWNNLLETKKYQLREEI